MAAIIGLLEILKSDDHLTNEQFSTVCQIKKSSYLCSPLQKRSTRSLTTLRDYNEVKCKKSKSADYSDIVG